MHKKQVYNLSERTPTSNKVLGLVVTLEIAQQKGVLITTINSLSEFITENRGEITKYWKQNVITYTSLQEYIAQAIEAGKVSHHNSAYYSNAYLAKAIFSFDEAKQDALKVLSIELSGARANVLASEVHDNSVYYAVIKGNAAIEHAFNQCVDMSIIDAIGATRFNESKVEFRFRTPKHAEYFYKWAAGVDIYIESGEFVWTNYLEQE